MSKKVIVSIVSDQTIPNVLFIKEFVTIKKYKIDKFVFITTEKIEKKGKTEHIIKGANIHEENIIKILVPEDDIRGMEKILEEEITGDYKYFVNITGGTKMMAIATYNFFKERESEIYYLTIGKNTYKKLHPYTEKRENKIQFNISLKEYLTSSGIEMTAGKIHRKPEKTGKIIELFVNDKINRNLLNEIRKNLRNSNNKLKKKIKKEGYIIEDKYKVIFEQFGIKKEKVDYHDIEYITGGWFEEYIYNMIKSKFNLDKEFIGINIKIKRQGIDNEFDIMFTLNNALFVIECKTSFKTGNKSIFIETLYKLSALKKEFGLYVKSYIFTLDEIEENSTNQKRAKHFNINIIDKKKIINDEWINNFI